MKTHNMNLHPQKLIILLATLAIAPVAYPSQTSSACAESNSAAATSSTTRYTGGSTSSSTTATLGATGGEKESSDKTASKLIAIGDKFYEKNDWARAVECYQRAHNADITLKAQAHERLLKVLQNINNNILEQNKKIVIQQRNDLRNDLRKKIRSKLSSSEEKISALFMNGLNCSQGLLGEKDFDQALTSFTQIMRSSDPIAIIFKKDTLPVLFDMALMKINEFDCSYATALQETKRASHQMELLKKTGAILRHLVKVQDLMFDEYGLLFDNAITERKEKFDTLNQQLKQLMREKRSQGTASTSSSVTQVDSTPTITDPTMAAKTALDVKAAREALLQTLLKQANIQYEAFLKKPTDARYQEAKVSLQEALALALTDSTMRDQITEKLNRLATTYEQQQKQNTAQATRPTEKQTPTDQAWALLDPFKQIKANISGTVQTKFNELCNDYLEVSNVKKMAGFTNLWRTRVGDLRIIYTVLPQQRAIGIVKIDNRDAVYSDAEELHKREALLHEQELEKHLTEHKA